MEYYYKKEWIADLIYWKKSQTQTFPTFLCHRACSVCHFFMAFKLKETHKDLITYLGLNNS